MSACKSGYFGFAADQKSLMTGASFPTNISKVF